MWGGPFQIAGRLGSSPLARRKSSSAPKVFSEPIVGSSILSCSPVDSANRASEIVSQWRVARTMHPHLSVSPVDRPTKLLLTQNQIAANGALDSGVRPGYYVFSERRGLQRTHLVPTCGGQAKDA